MSRARARGGLRHARLQFVLAVAAIAASVALPVVLVSVGGGVAAHELADLESAGYQIVVSASGLHGIENAHTAASWILGHVASVVAASPVLTIGIDAFNGTSVIAPVLAEGILPHQFSLTLGPTESDLFPDPLPLGDPNDSVHFANGTYAGPVTYDALVSSTYAASFHTGTGASVVLSPSTNKSDGTRFNVTGTFGIPLSFFQPAGAYAVLVPLSDLQALTGYANGTGTIVPDAADSIEVAVTGAASTNPSTLASIAAAIQAKMPFYNVTLLSQEADELRTAAGVLTGFYLALSSVGLAIGVLFLALVLLRRVESGRRSIGIRRALGLPAWRIAGDVLEEGFILAGTGAAVGLVGGYVLVQALASWGTSTVREAAGLAVFSPLVLAEILVGLVALSLLASGVAARAALRVDIVEALR